MEPTRSPIHDPLPGEEYIRVLVLHPGRDNDPISCELKVQTRRRSRNRYAAISYAWGDSHDKETIRCNGHPVNITHSLADALACFRHPTTIRRLWADALCINQDDDLEKGHQVARMGRVYRDAKSVLVWLGRDDDSIADFTFRTIDDINKYLDSEFVRHGRSTFAIAILAELPFPVNEDIYSFIDILLGLPWFERVWTVQECALAKECRIFWGEASIDCADVFEVALWSELTALLPDSSGLVNRFTSMHCKYYEAPSWQDKRPGIDDYRRLFARTTTFAYLLKSSSTLIASDPRDHVYAFLGCPYARNQYGELLIEVDYSIPVEEVFHLTACSLLELTREGPTLLSTLEYTSRRHLMNMEWPSWVPDWNEGRFGAQIANAATKYGAGGAERNFSAKTDGGPLLRATGFVFETVVWKSHIFEGKDWDDLINGSSPNGPANHERFVDTLWSLVSSASAAKNFSPDYEAFGLILLTNWGFGNLVILPKDRRDAYNTYLRKLLSLRPEYRGPSSVDFDENILAKFSQQIARVLLQRLKGKCMVLTHNGGLGIVPSATEIGDECCIILGAPAPLVLAPLGNGNYKLVGDSYMHGVMDGELVDKFDAYEIVVE